MNKEILSVVQGGLPQNEVLPTILNKLIRHHIHTNLIRDHGAHKLKRLR